MNIVIRLSAWVFVAAVGLGLTACKSSVENTTGAGGGSTSDGAGGSGAGQGGGSGVSSSSAGSGGGYIDCPEPPINFDPGECDILNNDCPDGKTCYPVKGFNGEMTTKCIVWSGVKSKGAACTSNEECAAGLFCAFYCSPPCCHSGPSDCDCTISSSGFGDPNAKLWTCNYLPKCDLFVADTCMKYPGSQCHLQNPSEDLATCAPPSVAQMPPMEGKTCSYINDCEAMQMCQGGKCRYSCLLDSYMDHEVAEGGCPPNQKCVALMPGHNYGYCSP